MNNTSKHGISLTNTQLKSLRHIAFRQWDNKGIRGDDLALHWFHSVVEFLEAQGYEVTLRPDTPTAS